MCGWLGSKPLREAMDELPCGCEWVERARRMQESSDKDYRREMGAQFQRAWSCPMAGYDGIADDDDELATHRGPVRLGAVRERVSTLTGAKLGRSCPCFDARKPHVTQALRIYRAKRTGLMRAVLPVDPPHALVSAVETIATAVDDRRAAEWRIRRAADRERARKLGQPITDEDDDE